MSSAKIVQPPLSGKQAAIHYSYVKAREPAETQQRLLLRRKQMLTSRRLKKKNKINKYIKEHTRKKRQRPLQRCEFFFYIFLLGPRKVRISTKTSSISNVRNPLLVMSQRALDAPSSLVAAPPCPGLAPPSGVRVDYAAFLAI